MTHNSIFAKEWLNRAYKIENHINSLEAQKKSWQEALMRVREISSNPEKSHDCENKIKEIEKNILEEIERLTEDKREIASVISKIYKSNPLKTEKLRNVLEYRYLCFMDWTEIATAMQYEIDGRYVYNIHNEALSEVAKILNSRIKECSKIDLQ